MAITAAMVKELRERSGAAMMDCKRALEATAGDIDAAMEKMRKDGQAKADKKAGRVAADGIIAFSVSADGRKAAVVEYNCETDFVAKGEEFQALAQAAADAALSSGVTDVAELLQQRVDDKSLDEARRELVTRLGENMGLRRAEIIDAEQGAVYTYSHGGRIGVAVALEAGSEELGKDIAMHVAASAPQYLAAGDVPAAAQDNEREILLAQAASSGKPQEIIDKMVDGRLRKFLGEITLLGQPFVKDPDITVGKLLESAQARVSQFVRFEVGEGIAKEEGNFADEVAAQAKAAMGA